MALKVIANAATLPWNRSAKIKNDDEHSDRLNHRHTTGLLLICAAIAAGSPFVFSRITCWVPAQFSGAYNRYTDNYCWISNTYYVPTNETVPHSKHDRRRAEIGYYQWVPFLFFLSAMCFYFPRMLWRAMNTRSGIDLQFLMSGAKENIVVSTINRYCQSTNDEDVENRFRRTLFCTGGKRLGNYLCSIYLMTKLLYLINSFVQLLLIQMVLGQPGWFYGFDIWHSVFVKNSILTDSPYFPRVTLCDLRIREVGNLHRYTVQCVLPINMLNEKLFALAWFWFVYVYVFNLCSFVSVLYNTCVPRSRIGYVRGLYRKSVPKPIAYEHLIEKFTRDYLMQDGVLILRLIERNASPILATVVVRNLLPKYDKTLKEEEKTLNKQEETTSPRTSTPEIPPFHSSEV